MNSAPVKVLALLWTVVSSAVAARAQMRLTLDDAVQQALSSSPLMEAAQAKVDQTRGDRTQAGLSPNPRVAIQSEDEISLTTLPIRPRTTCSWAR